MKPGLLLLSITETIEHAKHDFMNALRFSGKIEGGMIRLPEGYEEYDNTYADVIVLVEGHAKPVAQKEKLQTVFQKMQAAHVFAGVDNPVQWQKQMRDEWE